MIFNYRTVSVDVGGKYDVDYFEASRVERRSRFSFRLIADSAHLITDSAHLTLCTSDHGQCTSQRVVRYTCVVSMSYPLKTACISLFLVSMSFFLFS